MPHLPDREASDDLPPDLSAALNGAPELRHVFLALPPYRREYLRYIGDAKRPDIRAWRIERSLVKLREHAEKMAVSRRAPS